VGDRAAHLAGRPLDVDVNPLVVAGRLGELVDPLLVDQDPFAGAEVFANVLGYVCEIDDFHGFAPSVCL
jgi:hypothetical protein